MINTKNSVITYENGVLKRANMSDGTIKAYNDGHISRIGKGNKIKEFYTQNDGTKVAREFVKDDTQMFSRAARTEKSQ